MSIVSGAGEQPVETRFERVTSRGLKSPVPGESTSLLRRRVQDHPQPGGVGLRRRGHETLESDVQGRQTASEADEGRDFDDVFRPCQGGLYQQVATVRPARADRGEIDLTRPCTAAPPHVRVHHREPVWRGSDRLARSRLSKVRSLEKRADFFVGMPTQCNDMQDHMQYDDCVYRSMMRSERPGAWPTRNSPEATACADRGSPRPPTCQCSRLDGQ